MAAVKSEPGVCADCVKWSKKYAKLDGGRTVLRETVRILQIQIDQLITDKSTLNKEVEEARSQADREKETRVKESDARAALETELASMRSELHSLQENMQSETSDSALEVSRLRSSVSDAEKEIIRLNELVKNEKLRAEAALVEKKKASEAIKLAKSEKSRSEKEKRLACTKSKMAQEYKIQLDALEKEAAEIRSQLTLATSKCEEANTRLEAEIGKALAEKKRADLEKAEAEKQKSLADKYEKKLAEGKDFANALSCQLEEERKRNEQMVKQINELLSTKETEDGSAQIDISVGTGVLVKQLGVDKHGGLLESKQAVSVDVKAEMQAKHDQLIEKRVIEEKSCADQLSVLLEDERRKNHELQSRITELASSKKLLGSTDVLNYKSNCGEELKTHLEIEKEKTIKAEKRANLLKAEADFQRKLAQANEMKFTEEMSRANDLLSQLNEQKKRNEELEKKLDKLVGSKDLMVGGIKAPNDKDVDCKELTTYGKTKMKNTTKEKRCGCSNTVEQRRVTPPVRIKALDKEQHADKLTRTLQDSRQTVGTSINQSITHSQSKLIDHAQAGEVKCLSPHRSRSSDRHELKLIREQMKLAKTQLKHAKRVAKFERVRNSVLKKELDILKQEFSQFSSRLDFLDRSLSCEDANAHVSVKVERVPCLSWKEQKLLDLKPLQIGRESRNSLCVINKNCHNVSQPSKQALSPHFSGIKLAESTSVGHPSLIVGSWTLKKIFVRLPHHQIPLMVLSGS